MVETTPKRKPGWIRRLWRLGIRLAMAFVVATIVVVLLLRFLPLPVSAVMIGERVETGQWPTQVWVPWSEISGNMPLAAIAAEDQLFPEHHGFDLQAIGKAFESNQRGRGNVKGASTISQQVAKNVFLWKGRSWLRKGLEAWFTMWIELLWSKERILEVYLNVAEFGPGVYGVEAASQRYFERSASQLGPSHSARLAAVLPNPKKLSAAKPSDYVLRRQRWIERQMRQLGGTAYLDSMR
ncbi:MAG: monofunctional biosynthetic peptidoglycan transglycosylase [Ahniella sp.]|nr:monofunctional biosynthetic peptidoglycan transglycosylase [Ahniella sp.]